MSDAPAFTTDDFVVASTPERLGDGSFALRVPEGWQQGRGAFGGLVLGSLVRAIQSCETDPDRRLRSLSGEITAPVLASTAAIQVAPLRRGSGVTTWSATLSQGGEAVAHTTAVFGRTRITDRTWSPAPPDLGVPWNDATSPPRPSPAHFAQHFEFRPTGPLPFSGGKDPISAGWIRFASSPPSLGAPEIVALADAWWPAAFATEPGPRPAGTLAFTLQLFAPSSPLDPSLPLFHRARAVAAQDGFVVEMRELWTPGGELVAMNQQTFVWIK